MVLGQKGGDEGRLPSHLVALSVFALGDGGGVMIG